MNTDSDEEWIGRFVTGSPRLTQPEDTCTGQLSMSVVAHVNMAVSEGQQGRTMSLIWSRRQFLLGTSGALVAACAPSASQAPATPTEAPPPPATRTEAPPTPATPSRALPTLAEVEKRVGGRVGVFALDTATGQQVTHRADERFAMCSTFKWVLAAAVLARVERSQLSLDERVPYQASDLLEYAPVTRENAAAGSMTIDALAQAAVTVSDNTAANLLLGKIGGPAGLTEFVRSLDDAVTRLDRNEPTLNSNAPGDDRDTTSPRAMVNLMRRILCEDALEPSSRERLLGWLRACETGKNRLRAGLPPDWTAGDKTGSGERNAINDIAIAWPPNRAPILLAAYMSDGSSEMEAMQAAHADIARLVASELRGL